MESHEQHGHSGDTIHLPAPTAWPIVLAFGATLIFAGLVTHVVVSLLGAVLLVTACVGWFRQVLPHEAHEDVPVTEHEITIESERTHVTRIEIKEEHRAHLPLETYPVLSGLKGGIAGGFAMLVPALLYGLIGFHSIWYPVNLLGGAGVAHWTNPTTAEIAAFHPWRWSLPSLFTHPRAFWLDCSMEPCCRCCRGIRSSWVESSHRCFGQDCCMQRSGLSILPLMIAFSGDGS